jgi:flagellar biogenesis protein FliO
MTFCPNPVQKRVNDGQKSGLLRSVWTMKGATCLLLMGFMALFYAHPLFAATPDVVTPDVATPESSTAAAEPIDLMAEGLEVAGYLLILMVFAAVVIRLGKRFQPRMGVGGLIQVEDGHNLAPGVGVRLIRVGSRAWLVGVTRERVSLLAEMSQEEITSAKEGPS